MSRKSTRRITKAAIDQVKPGTILWDSEVRGFGLRMMPGGTRTFIFQFRDPVSRRSTKTAIGRFPSMTVDQARIIARAHRVSVDQGLNPVVARQRDRNGLTVADLAEEYLGRYATDAGLRPSTVVNATRVLKRYCLPKFGQRRAKDLLASDVRQMMRDAETASGEAEANRLRATVSAMFGVAIKDGHPLTNPCAGASRRPDRMRTKYLSPDEVTRLLKACDAHADEMGANAVRLLLFTGARLREVIHAEWSQFDLERGVWTKPSSHTKTKREHRLFLPTAAITILRRMKDDQLHPRFLFPGRSDEKPRSDLKRPWWNITQSAGLSGYCIHDLRRTNASIMVSTGVDLQTVGKSLGHTQAATTKRYAQIFDTVQRDGLERAVAWVTSLAA